MTDQMDRTGRIPALDELRDEFVRVAHAESRASGSHALRRVAVGLATLVLLATGATAAGIILTSDDDRAATSKRPPGGIAASGPFYQSFVELVAKTDLAIVGTVEEVLPPKVIEGEDPQYATREFNTVVRIDEVLKGSAPQGAVTVNTLELAFSGPGPQEWRAPGKRVLLFLSPSREIAGAHILANANYNQTAYLIHGEDLVATLGDDPLSKRIAALSLAQLRQAIREAGQRP